MIRSALRGFFGRFEVIRRVAELSSGVLYGLIGVVVLVAAAGIVCALFSALPFGGYKIEGYYTDRAEVCPLEGVEITTHRLYDPGPFERVKSVRIDSSWVKDANGDGEANQIEAAATAVTVPLDHAEMLEDEETTVTSPVLRTAPTSPGSWGLRTRYTVRGTVGFLPRVHTFTVTEWNMVDVRIVEGCRLALAEPDATEPEGG